MAQVQALSTFGLRPGAREVEPELGYRELREVAKHLVQVEEEEEWRARQERSPATINTVVETTGDCEGDYIEQIRQRLKQKYRESTFTDHVWSDPPHSGSIWRSRD